MTFFRTRGSSIRFSIAKPGSKASILAYVCDWLSIVTFSVSGWASKAAYTSMAAAGCAERFRTCSFRRSFIRLMRGSSVKSPCDCALPSFIAPNPPGLSTRTCSATACLRSLACHSSREHCTVSIEPSSNGSLCMPAWINLPFGCCSRAISSIDSMMSTPYTVAFAPTRAISRPTSSPIAQPTSNSLGLLADFTWAAARVAIASRWPGMRSFPLFFR
mmetsp:Transcript_22737/g.42698  ORF Transcript_22737/g.42698 Transcript_22737/m.42698 type:complete len:217 (+) Transcript_22737:358-1008(+)